MIWATVSSWSCFCWLYRASPSLAAENIINPISVLTIWWCPCLESSLVLLEEGVCYDQSIFLAKPYYSLPCFFPHSSLTYLYFLLRMIIHWSIISMLLIRDCLTYFDSVIYHIIMIYLPYGSSSFYILVLWYFFPVNKALFTYWYV